MMGRAKILDKIKKCMALGKSPNEHEAAAAIRQAQKLMDKYGITDLDLGTIGYNSETIHTSIQAGAKVPMVLSSVVYLVMRAFGVRGVITRSVRVSAHNFDVVYFGPEHRVMLAAYTHVVISRAVNRAWLDYVRTNPEWKERTGARAGFVYGWIQAVSKTVEDFAITDEESASTELVVSNHFGRELVPAKTGHKVYSGAVEGGASAADGFSLQRPVTQTRKQLENK